MPTGPQAMGVRGGESMSEDDWPQEDTVPMSTVPRPTPGDPARVQR
jgi:hypothetical protein